MFMEKDKENDTNVSTDLKDKKETKKEVKKDKAIFTSRVLFISVLDKIYLVLLAIIFVINTIAIFHGDISSLNYEFGVRLRSYILFVVIFVLIYLLFNWIYKCASKTMLCVTKNGVYKETYFPFYKSTYNIPLNRITKVSDVNILWIFRFVVINQYHHIPIVFPTWTNKEFKDALVELLIKDKEDIENEGECHNILSLEYSKVFKYLGIAVAAIIVLVGFVRAIGYASNPGRRIAGSYKNTDEEEVIILNKDGTCVYDEEEKCTWKYEKKDKKVVLSYKSGYYYVSDKELELTYDKSNKTLNSSYDTYKKLK